MSTFCVTPMEKWSCLPQYLDEENISRQHTDFSYHNIVLKSNKPGLVLHLWYVNCFTWDFTHLRHWDFRHECATNIMLKQCQHVLIDFYCSANNGQARQVDTKLRTIWESFRQNAALVGGDPPCHALEPHRSIVALRSPNWSLPRREQAEVDDGAADWSAADNACDLCCYQFRT